MTPDQFARKWGRAQLRERAGSQEHFLDICRLIGESTPAEADPDGEFFTFEKSLKKESGGTGFADVWRKRSVCFRGVGSARLHAPLWNQISTSPNCRSLSVNHRERVRTKRAVDYGRACWRRMTELPHPVSKRNPIQVRLAVRNLQLTFYLK